MAITEIPVGPEVSFIMEYSQFSMSLVVVKGHSAIAGNSFVVRGDDQQQLDDAYDVVVELMKYVGIDIPDFKRLEADVVGKVYDDSPCLCGCGCKNKHNHPTSIYCSPCRNGCCGE